MALFCQFIWAEEYFDYNDYRYRTTSDTTVMCRGHNSSGGPIIVTIPSYVSNKGKTYKVTSVGERAFYFDHNVTTINLPCTIDSIYDEAFKGSYEIQNVVFPNSIVYVGKNVFPSALCEIKNTHCMAKLPTSYIGEYTIPEGITQIAGNAFEDCKQLTKVRLPNSLKTIGEWAFSGCVSLDTLIIPDNVTYIGEWSLHVNKYLYIGKSVEVIGDNNDLGVRVHTLYWNAKCCHGSFPRKWNLEVTNIVIGDSVKQIPNNFCYQAKGIKNLIINEGCEEIGCYAFLECDSISEIIFPTSLKYVRNGAFIRCKAIEKIQFPNGLQEIGSHAFQECLALDSLSLPNSVSKIGSYAFSSCTSLISLVLPNHIERIDSSSFFQCTKLPSLVLPASLRQIDYGAFCACYALSSIASFAQEPPICGALALGLVNRQIPLYVPKGSREKYAHAYVWEEFMNTSEIETDLNEIVNPHFSKKMIKDGQIIISVGEKMYTITGSEL